MSVLIPGDGFCFEGSCCICPTVALQLTSSGIGDSGTCCCFLEDPANPGFYSCATVDFSEANGVFDLTQSGGEWDYLGITGPFCVYFTSYGEDGEGECDGDGDCTGEAIPVGDLTIHWHVICVGGVLYVEGEAGGNMFFRGNGDITASGGTTVTITNSNTCDDCDEGSLPLPIINCTNGAVTITVIS